MHPPENHNDVPCMSLPEIGTLAYRLRMFRLRRFIFGRFHRNPIVAAIAKQCWKNYSAWMNHDFALVRNGEGWLANRLAQEPSLGANPVFFDVGANNGIWSILAAQHNPHINVHAFELTPETYEELIGHVFKFGNVRTNPIGLFSRNGEIEIFRNRSSATTGAFLHPRDVTSETFTSRVMRGDDYLSEHGIERLNLLKIDVEGAEMEVLKGFSDALARGAIDVIQFEYAEFNIAARTFLKDYYEFLDGFRIGRLHPNFVDFRDYSTEMEDFAPSNYVAVRRELGDLIANLARGG